MKELAKKMILGIIMGIIRFGVFVYKHWALCLFFTIVCLFWYAASVEDLRLKNEYQVFKRDCDRRGGFVLQTANGKHCLDKSLQK